MFSPGTLTCRKVHSRNGLVNLGDSNEPLSMNPHLPVLEAIHRRRKSPNQILALSSTINFIVGVPLFCTTLTRSLHGSAFSLASSKETAYIQPRSKPGKTETMWGFTVIAKRTKIVLPPLQGDRQIARAASLRLSSPCLPAPGIGKPVNGWYA